MILTIFLFSILAIISLVWFFGIYFQYIPWMKTVTKYNDYGRITYEGTYEDSYSYRIEPPVFLAFEGGYLTVSKISEEIRINEKGEFCDENGNSLDEIPFFCTFYIWPEFGGDYLMGFMLGYGLDLYHVYVDKDLNICNYFEGEEGYDEVVKYFDEYRTELEDLMKVAEDLWGFDFS